MNDDGESRLDQQDPKDPGGVHHARWGRCAKHFHSLLDSVKREDRPGLILSKGVMSMSAARVGAWVKLMDRDGKVVNCQVVSVTANHIVVRHKDGKLWAMARNDFTSLRAMAGE